MATLTLTLSAGDIKKAVKSDTYITGQIDKAADSVKNAPLAYNEAAGDDSYHEVKLYRTMKGAVSKFEANMMEFVDSSSNTSVGNTLSTSTGDGTFTITIPVGSRFFAAFATTLSALAQEYIVNIMLYTWWQSIKPNLAKDYYQFAQESLLMVTKTLSKTPPNATVQTYADVTGTVDSTDAPKPEYSGQTSGLFYLRGTFSINGQTITNPIVDISEDNGEYFVEIASKALYEGYYWAYDESNDSAHEVGINGEDLPNAIMSTGSAALVKYGVIALAEYGYRSEKASMPTSDILGYIKI